MACPSFSEHQCLKPNALRLLWSACFYAGDLWLTVESASLCGNKKGTDELASHHRLPGLAESPLTSCLEVEAWRRWVTS